MNPKLYALLALGAGLSFTHLPVLGQANALRWQHLDQQADGVPGVSADRAYRELLKDRQPTPVLVAVIDSGIDSVHEDLKPVLWLNPREKPGNGLDDDQNGYADDRRGWSFLGNKSGQNITAETIEDTRLYARLKPLYEGKKRPKKEPQRAVYELYQRVKASFEKKRKEAEKDYEELSKTYAQNRTMFDKIKAEAGVNLLDTATLRRAGSLPENGRAASRVYAFLRRNNYADTEQALAAVSKYQASVKNKLETHLNPDFNPRPLVGDNPADLNERRYGNADIQGPDASHGTHVAGIIGGLRDNQKGVEGIAGPWVRIMGVRSTPNGDERDKDVANAIRYAVDNGAQIINMSFGKDYSPEKAAVDEAIRYADHKGVLLVKSAGNSSQNLDSLAEYPSPRYLDGTAIPNMLMVGASGRSNTQQELAAPFSNYGKTMVDVFAPGVEIYSSTPANTYAKKSGTSMATPVVVGIAAVLKSYFPQLTAAQIKQLIMQSAVPYHTPVLRPGTKQVVDFADLSKTGGIANLYEAVKLAMK